MSSRGVGMKAPRHSAAQPTTQSRQSRAGGPSAVAALNRRVGNGRLQQALLQRSPGYSTNCESLTFKTCKSQSCGYGGSGRCGWTGIKGGCKCVGTIKPPLPPRVPEREPEKKPLPFRARWHPEFEGFAQRLPYMEGLPGRELIVVLEGGLFAQAIAEAGRRRVQNMNRMMRVDPRTMPFIQVQPVLIGGAFVAGIVAVVALAFLLGPILIPLVEAAAAATAAAWAATVTAVGGALEAAAAAGWGFGVVTASAAAGIIAYLVGGGMSKAEAAEAVKPLLGKRILAVTDVAAHPELINSRPGQAVDIDGQAFNAIIQMSTGE